MNTVTLAILLALLFFTLHGAWRGLSGELAPLVGIIACCGVLAFTYAPLRAGFVHLFPGVESQAHTFWAGLCSVFLGGGAFLLTATLVKRIGMWVLPQPFNAILGGAVGALKVILLVGLIAGGINVFRDWVDGLTEQAERNPISVAGVRFWTDQFPVSIATLLSSESSSEESTPAHATPATAPSKEGAHGAR